jgi:hypothetical protein
VSLSDRRRERLRRLERAADLRARAARPQLAEAQRAEAEIRVALGRLEVRRAAVLAGAPAADAATARATAAWLRWVERERRRLLTEQAARRAVYQTLRQESMRPVARHAAIARLRARDREPSA